MSVKLEKIQLRNKNNIPIKFTLLEPQLADPNASVVNVPANGQGSFVVDLPDVSKITLTTDDGSHSVYKQSFTAKTEETGYYYYIYDAQIEYSIGSFDGNIKVRTQNWG